MGPWQIYRLPWKKVITHHYPIEADWWAGVKVILQISPRGQWLLVTGRKEREGELPHREPGLRLRPPPWEDWGGYGVTFLEGPVLFHVAKHVPLRSNWAFKWIPNKEHANGLNKDQGCPCYLMLRSNTGNADGEENSSQSVTPALFGLAYGTCEINRVSARNVLTILLGTMFFSGPEEWTDLTLNLHHMWSS